MKLSPKTKIVDHESPARTFYDEDMNFAELNEINKKAREDETYNQFEETEKDFKEEADAF